MIDSLSPEAGGPPECVRLLAKGYKALGAEIEVLCLDDPQAPFLRDIPCRVHALGQSHLGRFAFSFRLWNWLRSNANRYDGIVMNGIWSFPGIALHFAARRAGTPYGIFTHGALDPWFNRKYPLKRAKKFLYWPMQYAVLHHAAAVFFTCGTERDLARASFRPNSWNEVVIPFGICDPDEGVDPRSQIETFYRRFPQLRGRRYLLFLGRIHEKKGCDLLVDAFAKVAATAPDVDLVMAGPDQMGMQSRLAARAAGFGIADRVHWTGMIGGDLKWGALRGCDAFVLPSHQENFGISVVEALAVGRPVLISNQVNIWPEIEARQVGLVGDDTASGTEKLVSDWLNRPAAAREEMAARARHCYLEYFNVNHAAVAINTVFLLSRSRCSARHP
jgi:glycosyltransferase involved in cell wall biosynthesis